MTLPNEPPESQSAQPAKPNGPTPMSQTNRATIFGHEFAVYQGADSLLILQFDDLYLVAQATRHADILVPHKLPFAPTLHDAMALCDLLRNMEPSTEETPHE